MVLSTGCTCGHLDSLEKGPRPGATPRGSDLIDLLCGWGSGVFQSSSEQPGGALLTLLRRFSLRSQSLACGLGQHSSLSIGPSQRCEAPASHGALCRAPCNTDTLNATIQTRSSSTRRKCGSGLGRQMHAVHCVTRL